MCSYLHITVLTEIFTTQNHTQLTIFPFNIIHQTSIIFLKIPSLSVNPCGDNPSPGNPTSRSSAQRRLPEPLGTRSTGYSSGHTEIHGSARTGGPWAWFHIKLELHGCFCVWGGKQKRKQAFEAFYRVLDGNFTPFTFLFCIYWFNCNCRLWLDFPDSYPATCGSPRWEEAASCYVHLSRSTHLAGQRLFGDSGPFKQACHLGTL